MIIYGRNAVLEAVRGQRQVQQIWVTDRARKQFAQMGVPLKSATADEVEQQVRSKDHQGVCALVSEYQYISEAACFSRPDPLILALDGVQDPQNLGAICRTAEVAGVTAVVIPRHRSAVVTAAVCKASAGAVEHLSIARVRNLVDFLALAKQRNCWCFGAAAESSTGYLEPDYRGGVVLVMGAEGSGLRSGVAKACDQLVAIPQRGRIESLNVSAATAVLLYGALAQRS